jgi:serine/threonine protein kinase
MSTARQREEEIFDSALEIANAAERNALLDRACADNPQLRARLEKLLAAHERAERFFSDCVPARVVSGEGWLFPDGPNGANGSEEKQPVKDLIGSWVGPYKLLQNIGEGGCGVVYMAEQEKPVRRRVALKIIKLGMDTRNVIARFEAERQALALMDHPNIARVLDAGATETGRPYFVMELVRGVKLTTYCDQNRLETRKRLNLFIQVCHAIQHAHQKGIIHRDIKPSNILVTMHDGVPVPMVIDFGIAKAIEGRLTDRTLFTAYEQFIGTPAYMSPEQAEMSRMDVDTRSDIYSLGVLLYELLTGRTPFDTTKLMQSGLDEMRRTLREREPLRPSTIITTLQAEQLTQTALYRHAEPVKLASLLRGDLDWIVLKALEKDRGRRYQTANALAMDVQRYLGNEAVLARPPSRVYQLQKLIHRNKVLFASGAAVAIALAAGLGVSSWLLIRERELRRRAVAAEQEQFRLRAIAERGLATEAELRRQSEAREKIIQAAALLDQNSFPQADDIIAQIPLNQTVLQGEIVFRTLGEWHAIHEQWLAAKDRFCLLERAGRSDQPSATSMDSTRQAVAIAASGEKQEYERFCQEAIKTYAGTPDPIVAERTVKNCLLFPDVSQRLLKELAPFGELAKKSLTKTDFTSKHGGWQVEWRCLSLALWEYRAGHYSDAETWCRQTLWYGEVPQARSSSTRVILAMVLFQTGEVDEAQSTLEQAREVIEAHFRKRIDLGNYQDGFWFDWVLGRILLREATEMIGVPSDVPN